MRILAAVRLVVLLALVQAFVGWHSVLSAQELFKTDTLPRDWMSPQLIKPRLKALAGRDALNCGLAAPWSRAADVTLSATDVSDCALQAYASRKSFYARYDLEGIDVPLAVGFASDGQKVYEVTWMLNWGGRQELNVKDCPLPVTLRKMKSGRLDCFQPHPSDEPYLWQPQPEPYLLRVAVTML
jgi:hypothetical protein